MTQQQWTPKQLKLRLQERLDGSLTRRESEDLAEELERNPEAQELAASFESIHALLGAQESPWPVGLHEQIMARIDHLRRLERIYQRVVLALFALLALGTAFLYREALRGAAGTAAAIPGELRELFPIHEALSSVFQSETYDLSIGPDLPLALLVLIPLFIAINVYTLKRPELQHAA